MKKKKLYPSQETGIPKSFIIDTAMHPVTSKGMRSKQLKVAPLNLCFLINFFNAKHNFAQFVKLVGSLPPNRQLMLSS